jgi:protein-S-isoprenylcysteine O-methyltransferase Ste14
VRIQVEHGAEAYGLWSVVVVNTLIILIFVFSFFRPRTSRDWRTLGAFTAFVLALFSEMYGFPLTIYLLSGWLGSRFPEVNWLSHNSGHILQTVLGWQGDAHVGPLHLISTLLIIGGLFLLASSWKVLLRARQNNSLAISGPYDKMKHPQYAAFMMIMLGFLIQWPTLPTLVMFPFLVWLYVRLAKREERETLAAFGEPYIRYANKRLRFFPRFGVDNEAMGVL